MSSSSRRKLIKKLHEFIKIQGQVEKAPGFSSALGLGYDSVVRDNRHDDDAVTVDKNGLTLRFPVTKELLLQHNEHLSLSTYLAVIDDVTSWALVLGDEKRSRPGKSVSLSLWAGPSSLNGRQPGEEVDIVTTVEKIGSNVGFSSAHVRDVETGGLVCFASHIKYLPMGPLYDMALSSYGWKAATLYANNFLSLPPCQASPPLSELFDSFQFITDATAIFEVLPIHASLGGPIHGGCQAVLLEIMGMEVAKRELGASRVALDSIQVEYMSPPGSKTVQLNAEVLRSHPKTDGRVNMRVKLIADGKIKSQGVLCFSKDTS